MMLQLTSSSSDLAAALQLSMRAVQHENVDVRIHALTSLRDMMHSKQVPAPPQSGTPFTEQPLGCAYFFSNMGGHIFVPKQRRVVTVGQCAAHDHTAMLGPTKCHAR